MSDTPETDGLETHKADAVWRSVVPSKFARRLERERDQARRELAEARRMAPVWKNIASIWEKVALREASINGEEKA